MALHKTGWLKDSLDSRDHFFKSTTPLSKLPDEVDLRTLVDLPVLDQKALGACVAMASANAHLFAQVRQGKKAFGPSRLFIYYNARARMGKQFIRIDSGCHIRDAFKSLNDDGACPEPLWRYDTRLYAKKPPLACYREGKRNQSINYRRVPQTETQIKGALAEGFPIVFGASLYDSFDRIGFDGIVKMPNPEKEVLTGGHAMLMIGYKQINGKDYVIVLNSWGRWADRGYCYFPLEYLTDTKLSADFWTVTLVE